MAEDQGVNGDIWTEQISYLLTKSGWQKVASSNIDVEGVEGKVHGIDAMFQYQDGFNPKMNQGVFLEAKRYATTSFAKKNINEWVNHLNTKINDLKNSPVFLKTYPAATKLRMSNGIIAIWFHDVDNYKSIKGKLAEALQEVKLPESNIKRESHIRIFVLENEKILQIASMLNELENLKKIYDALNFYYPPSSLMNNPVQEINVLNLEYLFSDFILLKANKINGSLTERVNIVFYFGGLTEIDFSRLSDALLSYGMIHNQEDLIIYRFRRDKQFDKIQSDVIKIFKDKSPKSVKIENMENYTDLPSWILDQK